MKKYEEMTWKDMAVYGPVYPVAGLDAVTSKQLAQLLDVPVKEVSKHKARYEKELRSLGMFTASPKSLEHRLKVLGRTPESWYRVALEGGGSLELYCGNTVYFTAPAAYRLADVITGVNDEKSLARQGRTASVTTWPEQQTPIEPHSLQGGGMQVFSNPDFGSIRALEIGGEPWFVAADVCRALELEDVNKAVSRLDDDEGARIEIPHPQNPEKRMTANAVNEPGLYTLVLGSRKPEAKAFKRWIAHDVLPYIRKHGGYLLGQEDMGPEVRNERQAAPIKSDIMNIHGVECYEVDGTAYLNLETVAHGLGFTQTQTKNGTEYTSIRWERVEQYLSEFGFPHKWGKGDFIPENIFYRLAMKAKNEMAEAFQAKVADEVIPSIRRHGMYITSQTLEDMLTDPDAAIRMLQALKNERNQRRDAERKVLELDAENKALAGEQMTWDYRAILVRLVRVYGSMVYGDFQEGWRAFFRELRYKEGISLNNRSGEGPLIDRLVVDEWVRAVSVAVSMCKSRGISMQRSVNEVNMERVG